MAKACEIVSDLEHLSEDTIKKVLSEQGCITKWAYIKHDKDVNKDGNLKNEHWHIDLQFSGDRQFKYVAKWFGVPEQFVNKIQGRFNDALKYLTHSNAADKYQYAVDDVFSNFDFEKYIQTVNSQDTILTILQKICDGEIREYNYTDSIKGLNYVFNKAKIDAAFKYRRDVLARDNNRNMRVFFVSGDSGTGKTYFAKQLCNKLGLEPSVSSTDNDALQDYKGQPALILDDLREKSFSFTDLLKLLDPYTKSSIKSRYYNKQLDCELIIITSYKPLSEWYKGVEKASKESLRQLHRRISNYYEVSVDEIKEYEHTIEGQNILVSSVENPVKKFLLTEKSNFSTFLFDNFDNADLYLSLEEQREFNDIFCPQNDILPGNFFPVDDSPVDRDDPTKYPF